MGIYDQIVSFGRIDGRREQATRLWRYRERQRRLDAIDDAEGLHKLRSELDHERLTPV